MEQPDIYLDTLLIIQFQQTHNNKTHALKNKQKIKRNDHWAEIVADISAFFIIQSTISYEK